MHGVMVLLTLTAAPEGPVVGPGRPAPAARRDAVLAWNEVALAVIRAERTPPPMAARHLAMMHGAAYDAVNAIYQTHAPYRARVRATEPADPSTAVAIAAHRVLVELYPCRAERLDRALDETLAAVTDGAAKTQGMRLGCYVAEKMLAWRAKDGSARAAAYRAEPTVGVWRPTPPGFRPALYPHWPELTPFAVERAEAFRPPPPPELTSEEYTQALNEVKSLGRRTGSARTEEQTVIARFWDDGAGTATPPGHWNQLARVVAVDQSNSLAENARLFALLNVALADAGICCWDCKYKFRFWRPITAIRDADLDGNPDTKADPHWEPLLETPPFPSYTSGHSTFSGAASTILARFYGTDEVAFTVGSEGLPRVKRTFRRFSAAADEAGRSRIYGGIHYEFDNREGLKAGRALAEQVYRSLMRPRDEPAATATARRPR